MSLVTTSNFKEYYNALVLKQQSPSVEELFLAICRSEINERHKLERAEFHHFEDVLHCAGIFVADKKRREKNVVPTGLRPAQIEAWYKSREIYFPEMVPKAIPKPIRSLGPPGYPHIKVRELFLEESEIRNWIVGVEIRLREDIIRKGGNSIMAIKELKLIHAHEDRGRNRILSEEAEEFATIRKSLFLAAPPDYFRQKVIERYGATDTACIEDRELTIEELEERARQVLENEEVNGARKIQDYIDFIFSAYFHILNHTEIVGRQAIEDRHQEEIFTLIAHACRRTSGILYYCTPAVVFYSGTYCPVLKALTQAKMIECASVEKPVVYTGGTVSMDS